MSDTHVSPHTGKTIHAKWSVEIRLFCTGHSWCGYVPGNDFKVDALTKEDAKSRIKYAVIDYVVQTRKAKGTASFAPPDTELGPREETFTLKIA